MMTVLDGCFGGIVLVACGVLFRHVVDMVDYEFIDEIFHVKQCQKYCEYRFDEWDAKITTPPGLYVLGFLYAWVVKLVSGTLELVEVCTLLVLRSVNFVGGMVVLPIVVGWMGRDQGSGFWSGNITLQPLLFLNYFLFYTDVWSTIWVVLSLVLAVVIPLGFEKSAWLASIVSLVSVLFRQTNIVWCGFVLSVLIDCRIGDKRGGFPQQVVAFIKQLGQDWLAVVPYALNFILFAIFLKVNGGITFGDKENHAVVVHGVQVLYCFMFLTFFTVPVWFSWTRIKKYVVFTVSGYRGLNLLVTGASFVTIDYIIKNFTIVHPFLLADNRHYTFYLWRKVLSKSYSNYLMVPVYHFSTWNVVSTLLDKHHGLSLVTIGTFLGAVCLTLVPSPLFEPRYYVVPLVIYRMYIEPPNDIQVLGTTISRHVVEFCWLTAINISIMTIFLTYEFEWPTEPGIPQRIIW